MVLCAGLLAATTAAAQPGDTRQLAPTIRQIEQRLDGRLGVVIEDSGSGWRWTHRADERVPLNSTVKVLICAAVLDRAANTALALDERIAVREDDILAYAPITETEAGGHMSIRALCRAALDMSDNTATNLLLERLGGPQEITRFLRRIGDEVTRSDRYEPRLNETASGDARDTTTPAAMTDSVEALLAGDVLASSARAQLVDWMSTGSVTTPFLRASALDGWRIADKSGSGDTSRSLVAMVTPPDAAPYFVSIYLADARADLQRRDAAVIEVSSAVMRVLRALQAEPRRR